MPATIDPTRSNMIILFRPSTSPPQKKRKKVVPNWLKWLGRMLKGERSVKRVQEISRGTYLNLEISMDQLFCRRFNLTIRKDIIIDIKLTLSLHKMILNLESYDACWHHVWNILYGI